MDIYIVLKGDGDRNFIAARHEDGTYVKIAQAFDNNEAVALVKLANRGYNVSNGEI